MRDLEIKSSWTVEELKAFLASKYVYLPKEQIVLVEEETEEILNVLSKPKRTLCEYGFVAD